MMFQNSNPGKYSTAVLLGLLLLISGWVQAAQISVKADRNPVAVDETFQLVFTVEGEPDGPPDFSVLEKDFEVLGSSQSRNISIINGKTSRTTRFLVNLLPRRAGELTVPPVSFGKDVSPMLKLSVKDTAGGGTTQPGGAADQDVFMEVSVDNSKPWVQQQVILTVRIFSRIQWREASLSDPQFQGGEVLMQKLGEDRSYRKQRDGKTWQVIERRYALFPQKSGKLRMDALRLNLRVPAGRKQQRSPFGSFNDPFFDDFFSSRNYRTRVVRSPSLSLEVQPVPDGFKGSHWLVAREVQLQDNWSGDLSALKTGEPVTLTLNIMADGVTLGQLPELELPGVRGLRIYPDEPVNREQATDQGVVSTSSRKFAIIPTHPGDYELPAVEIHWWNSRTGREETARIPARRLKVSGAVQAAPATRGNKASPAQGLPPAPVTDKVSPPPLKTSAGGKAWSGINRWLLAGNLVLLLLWLITLALWLRARKQAVPRPGRSDVNESRPAPVNLEAARSALHQAVQAGDAAASRRALLQLAAGRWPEDPPRSLEALAQRVTSPLADELLNLSRHLYADQTVPWDGAVIETEMKRLEGDRGEAGASRQASALKPLYPESP